VIFPFQRRKDSLVDTFLHRTFKWRVTSRCKSKDKKAPVLIRHHRINTYAEAAQVFLTSVPDRG